MTHQTPGQTAPRKAFTLIEILVVVGIIALLAALAFPVFSRVRESGRRTSCTNNLRQLGLAFQQYLQDSSGRYPYAGNYQAWGPGLGHWVSGERQTNGNGLADDATFVLNSAGRTANVEAGAIYPYTKSPDAYVCPSTEDGDKKRLTYSMNCAIAGLSSVRMRNPSDIILLVDEGKSLNDGYLWAVSSSDSTDELTKAHNGGGNLLMADGSVKFFSFEQFPLKKDSAYYKTRTVGSPRFRDLAFGTFGVSQAGATNSPTAPISIPSATCFGAAAPVNTP